MIQEAKSAFERTGLERFSENYGIMAEKLEEELWALRKGKVFLQSVGKFLRDVYEEDETLIVEKFIVGEQFLIG